MTEKPTFREAVERAHIEAVVEDQRAWIAYRDGGPAPRSYSREVAFLKSLEAQGATILWGEPSCRMQVGGRDMLVDFDIDDITDASTDDAAEIFRTMRGLAPTVTDLLGDER